MVTVASVSTKVGMGASTMMVSTEAATAMVTSFSVSACR